MSTVAHSINKSSTATNDDEMSDSDLLAASQEIEEALQTIECFETASEERQVQNNDMQMQVVDLPVVHSADGTLSVQNKRDPSRMFVNCTFNAPVQILMK